MLRKLALTVVSISIACLAACAPARPIPDWLAVPQGPFALAEPRGVVNPVLTAADVTDRQAEFVADPFLFHDKSAWFLFFEVFDHPSQQGDLGVAWSADGLHWTYDQIVLDEPFHLSYPYVFQYNGTYYMLPETHQLNEVRLYATVRLPYEWRYQATLLTGRRFVDPSIFFYNGRWWLFVSDVENANTYLYYSTHLTEGWVEHPQSPVVQGDESKGRPGGRAFVYDGNRIVRLAQSKLDAPSVSAFRVDVLDTQEYHESAILPTPLLDRSTFPAGWNTGGIHHLSPWWVDDHWLAAFDGIDSQGQFSIGMCISPSSNR